MKDIAIAIVFAITGWMLKTYLTHRERMKELSLAKSGVVGLEQRLGRVEQAVEAIAVEVERVGEGQRYVTTLLTDRGQHALQQAARPLVPEAIAIAGSAQRPL